MTEFNPTLSFVVSFLATIIDCVCVFFFPDYNVRFFSTIIEEPRVKVRAPPARCLRERGGGVGGGIKEAICTNTNNSTYTYTSCIQNIQYTHTHIHIHTHTHTPSTRVPKIKKIEKYGMMKI